MTNEIPVFGRNRKSALHTRAIATSSLILFTFALISTPVLSETGNSTQPESNKQAGRVEQVISADSLQRILHDSGILPQLTDLSRIIISESRDHWQNCESSDAQLEPWLIDAFAADEMTRIATEKLQDALDAQTLSNILDWLDSTSGQAVIHAEHSSASLSESDFEHHRKDLDASSIYRTKRAPRIRALIEATRAGNFVSVVNTEINNIVSLSIACSPSSKTVHKLLNVASAERQDLSLVSFFMNIDLMAPTAVVYRQVENRIIDDYIVFSESPTGKAYHATLIDITRSTLIDRLEAFASRLTPAP